LWISLWGALHGEAGTATMHYCYAHFYLPFYKKFIAKVKDLGHFKTLDKISGQARFGSLQVDN
jgi:hypothetical protein